MNDIIRTLQFEKEQLEARNRLLENKLESDNRQISEYDIEVRQLRELLHRVRSYYGQTVSWIDLFEDDYMKLIGGESDE